MGGRRRKKKGGGKEGVPRITLLISTKCMAEMVYFIIHVILFVVRWNANLEIVL